MRHYLGIAAGSNARHSYYEVLIAKNKWILKETWDKAIRAKNKGNATKEQKEILKMDIGMYKHKNNFIQEKGVIEW